MHDATVSSSIESVRAEMSRAIVGKRAVLDRILAAIIAGGHVLIEDVPGLAKTMIARSFAQILDLSFSRIQFTPDLLPGDITGSNVFNQESRQFEFVSGPVFANLILADEINRASPKTQSALLEAMQEGHVTVEGITRPVDRPFLVVATQNPIELEGTYPLPEAQLDRFMIRISVGYPSPEEELEVITRRGDRHTDEVELTCVLSSAELSALQELVESVYFDRSVGEYAVAIVGATREDRRVAVGASPRGTIALFKMARAIALIDGRDYVNPDDVKSIALEALSHRIVLKPEFWARRTDTSEIVRDALARVPVPEPVSGPVR